MFTGAAICMAGMSHANNNEMEIALACLEEGIQLLEQNIPRKSSHLHAFAMTCLGKALWLLASSIWRYRGDIERTLSCTAKVLEHRSFLDATVISSTLTMSAVCQYSVAARFRRGRSYRDSRETPD